jgi:hypothetical protein
VITCPWEELEGVSVGDLVTLHGKAYRVTRKGTNSAVVSRYYWFDAISDFVARWLWPK